MAPVLATLIILAGLSVFAWLISSRIRPLLFARKDVRWDDPATRTERLVQKKERMTLSWEGVFSLCMILGVLCSDVLIDAAMLARSAGEVPWYLPVSGRVADWFLTGMAPTAANSLITAGVLIHIAIVM